MQNKRKKVETAIVTGGGSGIGFAIAKKLALSGVNVVLASRNFNKLTKSKKKIVNSGVSDEKVAVIPTDVRRSRGVQNLVARVIKIFGTIDCLIYSAGVSVHGEFEDICEEDWDEVVNTNLKGLFLCCNAVWPTMLKNKYGHILAITSASGLRGYASGSIYCASKAGANMFLEALSQEGQEKGIKVSVICPGQVNTPIWPKNVPEIENARGKMLTPSEIGEIAWHILSSPFNSHYRQVVIHPFAQQPYLRGKNRGPKKKRRIFRKVKKL